MSSLSLKCLMETSRLTGSNYRDWIRCVRVVLRLEHIEYVLDKEICSIPDEKSPDYAKFDKAKYEKHVEDATTAQCVMISSMTTELQRQHENMMPFEMIKRLESLYASRAKTLQYEILKDLFDCKLNEGEMVSDHVLKMIGLIERLATIGTLLPESVSISLILHSLPSSFEQFIVSFNINNAMVGLPDLHNMLMTYESSTTKGKAILMVNSSAKNPKYKGKNKQKKRKTLDVEALKPKSGGNKKPKITKDECLFCHEIGHWKRDCPKFKAQGAST